MSSGSLATHRRRMAARRAVYRAAAALAAADGRRLRYKPIEGKWAKMVVFLASTTTCRFFLPKAEVEVG